MSGVRVPPPPPPYFSPLRIHLRRLEPVLRRALRGRCQVAAGSRVLIAVSGGADSTALLLALASLRRELGVVARGGAPAPRARAAPRRTAISSSCARCAARPASRCTPHAGTRGSGCAGAGSRARTVYARCGGVPGIDRTSSRRRRHRRPHTGGRSARDRCCSASRAARGSAGSEACARAPGAGSSRCSRPRDSTSSRISGVWANRGGRTQRTVTSTSRATAFATRSCRASSRRYRRGLGRWPDRGRRRQRMLPPRVVASQCPRHLERRSRAGPRGWRASFAMPNTRWRARRARPCVGSPPTRMGRRAFQSSGSSGWRRPLDVSRWGDLAPHVTEWSRTEGRPPGRARKVAVWLEFRTHRAPSGWENGGPGRRPHPDRIDRHPSIDSLREARPPRSGPSLFESPARRITGAYISSGGGSWDVVPNGRFGRRGHLRILRRRTHRRRAGAADRSGR